MTLNDPIANALSKMTTAEKLGRKTCLIKPVSSLIRNVLDVLNRHNFIGEIEEIEDGKGTHFKVHLLGNINQCGVIKPRFAVKSANFERFEKQFLPAKDFGFIIISTSDGVTTHIEAKKKGIGGKLLAYCY